MIRRYVIDTSALICFFSSIFGRPSVISTRARKLIQQALSTSPEPVRLSIPSIVFVEVFEKWITNEEFAAKFFYEVFSPLEQSPNIEIKSIEREVLENLILIGGSLSGHEINDKIILASAIMLQCPLITTDDKIIEYVKESGAIPSTIS